MDKNFPLPTRTSKKWKTTKSTTKTEFKPLRPNFCPNIKEDGKKCGKFMNGWDIYFYEKNGIGCEICTLKELEKAKNKVEPEIEIIPDST